MLNLQPENVRFEERVKKRIFEFVRELMRLKMQMPLIVMLIIVVVEFYLISGVFFISNPLSVSVLNDIFRYQLLLNMQPTIGLSLRTIIIILLIIQTLGLVGFFIIWAYTTQHQHTHSSIRKPTTIIFWVYRYCVVILVYFVVQIDKVMLASSSNIDSQLEQTLVANYSSSPFNSDPVNIVLVLLLNLVSVAMFVVNLPIIYFTINPLRKGNKLWSYNNQYEFVGFILNFARAFIIAIDGLSATFVLLSFICHLFVYMDTQKHPPLTTQLRLILNFKNNLQSSLHISVFLYLSTTNTSIASQCMLILTILTIVKVCLQSNNYSKQQIYFPLCNQQSEQFYHFYFIFEQKSETMNSQNSKLSGKKLSMQQVFQIHITNCRSQKCVFNHCTKERLDEVEYCRKLISKILDERKNDNPQSYILNELWLLEIGVKTIVAVQERLKVLTIEQQFVVEYAKDFIKSVNLNQNDSIMKTQNVKTQSFYAKIDLTLQCFSRFYAEVQKSSPEFETLIDSGYECKMNMIYLKNAYNQNLKNKSMTFKMLQVYIEFQTHFGVSLQSSSMDWVDKGEQLQKNQGSSSLQELYQPTIFVNATSGLIQSSNLSACNFLKQTKYELKLKPITQLFHTDITMQDLTSIISARKRKSQRRAGAKCIIKRGNQQTCCTRMKIEDKTMQNHSVLVISFEEEKLFHNRNIYAVDDNGLMLASIRKRSYFKMQSQTSATAVMMIKGQKGNRGNRKLVDWQQLFQSVITPEWQKLKTNRIIKLNGNQTHIISGLLLIVNLQTSISTRDYIVTVTVLVNNMGSSENRLSVRNNVIDRSSDLFNKKKSTIFKFYYSENNQNDSNGTNEGIQQDNRQKGQDNGGGEFDNDEAMGKTRIINSLNSHQLSIVGANFDITNPKHQHLLSTTKNFSSSFLLNNLSKMMVNKVILNQASLSSGIKTYRLWKQDLYNIDLEDKEAYIKTIDEQSSNLFRESAFHKKTKYANVTIYLFALIVLLVIGLGVSIYFLFNQSISDFQTILSSYKKQLLMQSIYMSFNKINAMFRDVKSGLYKKMNQKWQYDMIQSLNKIKARRMLDLDLFQTKPLKGVYQNITYQGNFNELLDIFLSEASSMVYLGSQNATRITDISEYAQNYIYGYFTTERQNHFNILLAMSQKIDTSLKNSFYISLALVIVIGALQLKLYSTVMQKLKQKLNYILLTSDYEAKVKFQNSEKIRYVIDMIQKNFQIDFRNLLKEKTQFQKRKKSKQPRYNKTKKLLRTLAIVAYFGFHIAYVSICQSTASHNIQHSSEMFNLVRSLFRCYTRIVQSSMSIANTGKVNPTHILQGQQSLQYMDSHRGNSAFGTYIDQIVEQYMYSNLCLNKNMSSVLFAGMTVTCEKATPHFEIESPMQLGVLQYVRRTQYQLVNNVTQTFAISGVFATPFARLFNLMADKFYSQGQININEYINTLISQNQSLIILSLVYILLGAYFLWIEFILAKQIKTVTDFFKKGQQARLINEVNKRKIEEEQKQAINQYKKNVQSRTSIAGADEEGSFVEKVKHNKNKSPIQQDWNEENQLSLMDS